VGLARRELLITTPYLIPGESLLTALCIAAGTGTDVRILVPARGDSVLVSLAAASYYEQLLRAGVRIFRYEKGFVHAKTMVIDRQACIVGTANLDERSFELNFEINATVYDEGTATELAALYAADCREASELVLAEWSGRGRGRRLVEKLVRLLSPVL
jgi:cardiolipin synthase